MTRVYLIVAEGDAGTTVTAYRTEADADAAYVTILEMNYGRTFTDADEAWEYMDAQRDDWNYYVTSAPLYGEEQS